MKFSGNLKNFISLSFVFICFHNLSRLPPSDEPIENETYSKYHSANELEDDCRNVFSKCPISIWNAGYNLL